MSVKVNLLPREAELRIRERRVNLGAGIGMAVWVLVLALLYAAQVAAVHRAEDERDAEQAELARLQAEADELAPYRALAAEYDMRNALLAGTMSGQIAWSAVLNDLALVFPSNSSLLTMSAAAQIAEAPENGVAVPAGRAGQVDFTGYSVERYAPGVESVLLGMGDAAAFTDLYLSSAGRLERNRTMVTSFQGSAGLTEAVYTLRFVDGLPEVEQ